VHLRMSSHFSCGLNELLLGGFCTFQVTFQILYIYILLGVMIAFKNEFSLWLWIE
jgi:hypothetical protein